MLGVHIDVILNSNFHIDIICKPASNKQDALVRLKKYLWLEKRYVLANSSIYSNFHYCSSMWIFSNKTWLNIADSIETKSGSLFYALMEFSSLYGVLWETLGKPNINLGWARFNASKHIKNLIALIKVLCKNCA